MLFVLWIIFLQSYLNHINMATTATPSNPKYIINVSSTWRKDAWIKDKDNKELFDTYIKKDGNLQYKKDLFLGARERLKKKHTEKDGVVKPLLDNSTRRQWRCERMEFYNNLLMLAVGAKGELYNSWFKDESALHSSNEKFDMNLNNDTIFKFMLDNIHEDEEIMFKVYDVKTHKGNDKDKDKAKSNDELQNKWNKYKYIWLDQSLKRYVVHFLNPVVDLLTEKWVETQTYENRTTLLELAKKGFQEKLCNHGISWDKRSWRSRARLYWLLGLYRHAPIFNGKLGNFKGFDYIGPIGELVQKMLQDDVELLKVIKKVDLHFDYEKEKYHDKKKLGNLKVCQVLSWASAANDYRLVATILKHNLGYMALDIECSDEWKKSWEEAWAMALWNAAYRGHEKVVKELLKCEFPHHVLYSKYFIERNSLEPPLHVAVRKGYISVVDVFCFEASRSYNCHEKNDDNHTPLEIATNLKKSKKSNNNERKKYVQIQSILLSRPEVQVIVEESRNQRQLKVDSANAILVGATLFAGITFGGWLQPPLGYNSYYQFVDPSLAAPPDSYESYMSIQGHKSIQVFTIFNSLSFFFAVASIIASIDTIYFVQTIEDTYITDMVEKLQDKLKWAIRMFIILIICSLVAFASAGIAILPPIQQYQRNMYITIVIGGIFCLVFLCKMFWFCIPRRLMD